MLEYLDDFLDTSVNEDSANQGLKDVTKDLRGFEQLDLSLVDHEVAVE